MLSSGGFHRGLLASLLAALCSVGAVRAHQPFESTTAVQVEDSRLVLTVIMAAEMATVLATVLAGKSGPIEETRALDRGNLEQYRPRFMARAAEFFRVLAVDRQLQLERAVVRMNHGGELELTLYYPAPLRWPLRLQPAFLGMLPAGYGNLLSVFDAQDRPLGRWLQTSASAEAEMTAPMVPADREIVPVRPAARSPSLSNAEAPPRLAEAPNLGPRGAAVAVGGALFFLIILLRRRRKTKVQQLAVAVLALALAVCAAQAQRQMEKLGRGVVAVRSSSTQVYVGWRLLGTDPEDVAFNLYRSANGGAPVKINATPLTASTNYTDTPGSLTTASFAYSVRPVIGGVEVPDTWAHPLSAAFTLPANAPQRQYLRVPLQATPDGAHRVGFCWVGDLEGDGEYDFVLVRHSETADQRQFLEAYQRDGTLLWRMDLGPNSTNHYNIEPGSSTLGIGHGDNATVYDLDGDGRAEVIVRTAGGVVFGNGVTLVEPDNRQQFLSIVDGLTGAELARAPVPNPYLADGPMNGHMGIVYLDGQRPSVLLAAKNRRNDNGFQGLTSVWDFRNGALTRRWSYDADTLNEHAPEAHQIRLGDPDNDGKDELLDIGYGIDDTGLQLFNIAEIVHGDRFHMADIDPDRPGLETYLIQQDNPGGLATALVESATGKFIKKWYAGGVVDVGRGLAADLDPARKGYEMFSTQGGIFDAKGNQIYNDRPFPPEGVWWDDNLSREFLATVGSTAESPAIARFDSNNPGAQARIYTIYNEDGGVYWAYGGRAPFWGDLLGDWREEIIVVANDNSEIRIYTTKTPAPNRLYTLMHNPQYRIQATTKGYVQGSNVDYYLGDGMTPPPPPPMVEAKLVWRGGAGATTWDLGATASWLNSGANSAFANGDSVRFDLGGNHTTTVALNGTLRPGAVTVYSPKSYSFDGAGGSLAGAMKLVKAGAGPLTITGAHSFTGKTTVWDGALLVNGDLQGSAVTVWGGTFGGAGAAGATGGRIGGSGRFSQPVAVQYRGAITPGNGMGHAATLSFGAGLSATDGAVLAFDLSDDPTGITNANDRLVITGNLALSGKVAVIVNALNSRLAPGAYTLATYTGTLTGGVANLAVTVPSGTPYTIAAGGGVITLTVPATRAPASVVWRGSGGNWDLAASQNWLRNSAPDVFVAGDTVTFDGFGAAAAIATLATGLPTAGVTVNAANDYTFTGAGALAGSGGLTKTGAGTLTLKTINSYTGPTTVNGGVLAIAALSDAGEPSSIGAASAGASNLVLNGGTLRHTGSQTNTNRNLILGASGGVLEITNSSIQMSGVLSGSGRLSKSGPGTLLLARANTYSGGTTLNGGTIYLAGQIPNVLGLGSGAITFAGGTLTMADVRGSETAAWNLVVPAGASGRLNADGRCSLTGTLTGAGTFTYYTPFIRTDLRGNWSAFTGRILVADGTDFRITNSASYGGAALQLGADVVAYYNSTMSCSLTLDIGELAGSSTASLRGGPTDGRALTWRIGARNNDSTFAGIITDGSGPTALTKVGHGALTLSGVCTYTGATTVQAGALLVNGALGATNVTVQNGASLGGSGAITGNVTVQAGGRLAFVANNGAITGLNITGNLTLNGPISITPAASAGGFAQGTYTVLAYTGSLSGSYSLVWLPPAGSQQTATFDTSTPGVIRMTVARPAAVLTWTGAAGSAWDSATTNWTLGGAHEVFVPPDSALFDDTASTTTVVIAGPLAPGGVLLDHSTKNFALSGSGGGLSGGGGITKNGSGKATFYSANSHSGPATINAGILALGNDGSTTAGQYQSGGATGAGAATNSFGSGAITINASGQLRLGGRGGGTVYTFNSANAISFDGGTLVSFDGQQKLTGGVTVAAGGAKWITAWSNKNLWLNSVLSGAGPVTIDDLIAGVSDTARALVRVDTPNNPYQGTITINGPSTDYHGGRLQLENDTALANATVINNNTAAAALLFTTTAPQLGALGGVGNVTISAASLTVGGNGASTSYSGALSGSGALIKTGTGTFTLAGSNSYTGATTVSAGTLRLAGTHTGGAAYTVATGATLELAAGTLAVAGPITNQGTVRLLGSATLSSTGNLTNQGVLDLINGPQTLSPNFVNQGTVVDSSSVRVQQLTLAGGELQLSIQSYPGHRYQLQRRASLTASEWTDLGAARTGTGEVLVFAAGSTAEGAGFFRVVVSPNP